MPRQSLPLCKLYRFDSIREMMAADGTLYKAYDPARPDWTGGLTKDQTRVKAIEGDMSAVAKAESLLAKFSESLPDTARPYWGFDVAGAFPDVPSFLAGVPENMRRRMQSESSAAPIRIVIDACCSGGVESDQMVRRGVTTLALVIAASAVRPVSLWIAATMVGQNGKIGGSLTRINSEPMDMATAAFVLGSPALFRNFQLNQMSASIGNDGGHGCDGTPVMASNEEHVTRAREIYGLEPTDVFVPGAYYKDPIIKDPEGWLIQAMHDCKLTVEE